MMADSQLRPIRKLKTKCDLTAFSHFRHLDTNEFFPSCWIAIMDLLLMQKEFDVLLAVFIQTIYFFPQSNSKRFDNQHAKIFKRLSNLIENKNSNEIKRTLFEKEFRVA